MACRPHHFIDESDTWWQSSDGDCTVLGQVDGDMHSLISLLEEEKLACVNYATAWTAAALEYESSFHSQLSAKDKKIIDQELPKTLPECLKEHPSYMPIAVIVLTQEEPNFAAEFNDQTRQMITAGSWNSFPYKSLFMLLNMAIKYLPGHPDKQMEKNVFRGFKIEHKFEVGEQFALGYFASFTPKRFLARGRKQPICGKGEKGTAEEADDDDNDNEENVDNIGDDAASCPPLTGTLVRFTLTGGIHALGVRHLSAAGVGEKEVLLHPLQKLRVKKVNSRPNVTVVQVEPVKSEE